MVLTEEEWLEWKGNPTTREFFRMLHREREKVKEELLDGIYEEDERARGIAICLRQLQELTYDNFREAAYEKQEWDSPKGASNLSTSQPS